MAHQIKKVVVTLGVFDGVHRGHQHIFRRVVQRAKKIGGTPVAYTFDPHPAKILAPDTCPPMINTLRQKIELIRKSGIRRVVVQKFTKSFSHRTPEDFFTKTILQSLRAKEIFVGYNFTFGIHRSGTTERLETLAQRAGIKVTIVEAFFRKETLVSSTQVRQLLAMGNLPKVENLLGHPYFIEGRVVHGRGIGGRDLGIHTANLRSENDPILPTGVYVSRAFVGSRHYRSVTNIGPNPTFTGARAAPAFGGSPSARGGQASTGKAGRGLPLNALGSLGLVSIETHILDFRRNIIGRRIRVEFLEKIREEIAFASPQDLARQIRNDIRTALRHFKEREGR